MAAASPSLRRDREKPCRCSLRAEQAVGSSDVAEEYSRNSLCDLPTCHQEEAHPWTLDPQRDRGGHLHVLPTVRCSEDARRDCVRVDVEQEGYWSELQVHASRARHVRASFSQPELRGPVLQPTRDIWKSRGYRYSHSGDCSSNEIDKWSRSSGYCCCVHVYCDRVVEGAEN